MSENKKKISDQLKALKTELRQELGWRKATETDNPSASSSQRENIVVTSNDAPVNFSQDDVTEIHENHFRLNLGCGFGLDVIMLYSESLAFRSYDGNLLDLDASKGWPASLFNPTVGKA